MSSFIVSNTHAMAVAASYVHNVELGNRRQPTPLEVVEVAKIIMKANITSVNHRYNKKTRMTTFNGTSYNPSLSDTQILKLIDCIDYQSSGVSTWSKSKAKRILDQLSLNLLTKLINNKEYNDCLWTI
jgi:hypothetical protein